MPESSVVVNFKAYGDARRGVSAATLSLLHASRDRLADGMVEILARHAKKFESALFTMADRAPLLETRNACFAGQALLRDQPGALSAACRKAFFDAFDEAIATSTGTARSESALELSLIGDDIFEATLAQDKAAARWRFSCAESLVSLDARMAHLLGRPDMPENDNPLGPKLLCRAIFSALAPLLPEQSAQVVMLNQCELALGDELPGVYSAINRLLIDQGVLPDLKLGSQSQPASRDQVNRDSRLPDPEHDLFDAFEALMRRGSGGSGFTGGGAGGGAPVRLFDTLSAGAGAGGGMALPDGSFFSFSPREGVAFDNILRRLQETPAMQAANPLDAMLVDAIAMLFDTVFEAKQATDGLKAQIGRLQIPVLRIALQDRSLFTQRGHPVRRTLDALARLAPRLPETEQGALRLGEVTALLDVLIAEHETADDAFVRSADALAALEAQYEAAFEVSIAPEISAQLRDERAEIAPLIVHDAINRATDTETMPTLIADFLRRDWARLLTCEYLEGGAEAAGYRAALETMRELVWSVAPKAEMDARLSLVRVLPGLLRRLREGCARVEVAHDVTERFFAGLVVLHANAVRPNTEIAQSPEPASERCEPVADPAPVAAPVVASPAADEAPEVDDEFTRQVLALEAGDWIEFRYPSGPSRCARLGWVSRVRNTYLFSDQDGLDSFSIKLARLADKLRQGEASVLERTPITESAFDKLMHRVRSKLATL